MEASCLSYKTFINQNFSNLPPSIGCEDFYDEKAKQKKADLAESLGTDVGDKVHFLLSKNCNSYLWTMIYKAPHNAFDAGNSITRASGRWLGPGNRGFFGPCEVASNCQASAI